MKRLMLAAALLALLGGAVQAADQRPVKPTAKDRCPVCGMFVAKYPDFLAQVIYADGTYALFDGAKDMFKYLFNPRTYAPSRKTFEIGAIYVTDYYSLLPIDGKAAWYVLGSDVLGPMGRELIPFRSETEAKGFMADHKGTRLLRFGEVTATVLQGLD
jgi:nitrous oxide reductase accessory protein NosL